MRKIEYRMIFLGSPQNIPEPKRAVDYDADETVNGSLSLVATVRGIIGAIVDIYKIAAFYSAKRVEDCMRRLFSRFALAKHLQ